LNPKNLVEAKKVVKGLLKNELRETHLRSNNIDTNSAILQSDKIFCLVQYMDKIHDDLNHILPETATKINWNSYVLLEKTVFESYAEQLENIKKERPAKGTVVFVLRSGEVYMISPYALMDFLDEYPLLVNIEKVEYFSFPTIFLQVPDGAPRSEEELEAQHRIALISQINSLKPAEVEDYELDDEDLDEYERDFYASFFSDRSRKGFSPDLRSKYSELADDDIRNITIHLLYEMSKNLTEIRKELKSIKKIINGR
jgi:hypothetical protein